MTRIKWESVSRASYKTKEGQIVAKIPSGVSVYKVHPNLRELSSARKKFSTEKSTKDRILVAVETTTGLMNYYTPVVPVANLEKDVWLPKDAEIISEIKREYEPEYILGKTIIWGSRNARKTGKVLELIPSGRHYMELMPDLESLEGKELRNCGVFISIYERILVRVDKSGTVEFYTPIIPKENVDKGLYLPKQGEVIAD